MFSFAVSMDKSSLAGRCMQVKAEFMKPTISPFSFVYFALLKPSASSWEEITGSFTVFRFLPVLGVEINLEKAYYAISSVNI